MTFQVEHIGQRSNIKQVKMNFLNHSWSLNGIKEAVDKLGVLSQLSP